MTGRWARIAACAEVAPIASIVASVTNVTAPPAAEADSGSADVEGCNSDPPLPDPGTPERDALDMRQADMVAGLLRCATPGRVPRRIQFWRGPAERAVPGDRCSGCGGRRWWCAADGSGGCLSCQTCRPGGADMIVT